MGLTAGNHTFSKGPWSDQSAAVSGVIDMFGPVDRQYLADTWRVRYGARPNPVFGWFTPSVVRAASAVSYTHPGAPPFLVVQGMDDTVVPPWMSVELYDRLRQAGDSAQLISIQHAEHEFVDHRGPISPSQDVLVQSMANFLLRCVQWPDTSVHDAALSDVTRQQASS